MLITREDVEYLCVLNNISISDKKKAMLQKDLSAIAEYISQLGELNTAGVEPTYQVTRLSNAWREDEIKPQIEREKLLALAPDVAKNQVKVPKVL